ncbi:MAG TPA: hypothetical protein VGL78_03065 [Solirubrobacteraceae bacterium]|jgi:hypothetical protein
MRPRVRVCRPVEAPSLDRLVEQVGADADAEESLAKLRDAVVGREDDLPVDRVPAGADAGNEALEAPATS